MKAMKKLLAGSVAAAVMLMLLMPGLGQKVFAREYTVTWDPNGGTPGQEWVDSTIVTYDIDTVEGEPWWTPNYNEAVVAPPDGMEFDAYDINGTRVAAVTAIRPQSLITSDTVIKYLWKPVVHYTITYDANGGTKGPDWVDSIVVNEDRSDWVDYLPGQEDSVVAPPEGKEFDAYDINGIRVAAHTSTKILPKEDLTIKYLWKQQSKELYIYEGDLDTVFKKKSPKPIRFRFVRKLEDERAFELFRDLLLDGAVLDRSRYIARRGSLEIELAADYLETLAEGTHTLQPLFTDGEGPAVSFVISSEDGSGADPAPDAGSAPVYQHEHDYVWQVVKEATPEIDGEMINVCKVCGAVRQRLAITGYTAFNLSVADGIRKALPGAEVRVKTDKWISLYSPALDALKERPDVKLVIDFRYQGKTYEVAIPAGTDAAALKDANGYAGFLFLGAKFGIAEIPAK